VEGSQIDYQGHGNNTEGVVDEVLDFDRAIKVALDFAKRDGNTLVVITADHETGGMTIMDGSYADSTVVAQFNTGGHTGTMVPIYSYGPQSAKFTGIMENIDIPTRIKTYLGLK
jgi:alkaline phosphatase